MKSEAIPAILKKYKLKVTPVRIAVLRVLIDSDTAMSHADIAQLLSDQHFDKVTLYRTLSHFTEKGIVHKVATEDRSWLYAVLAENNADIATDKTHAHFICDDCDKIFCFPIDEGSGQSVKSMKKGFLVKELEIRLHGVCPSCQ
ncbi:MAG: transcriptional repressor [Bacteroidetes bacterium]|nr:transcriptional repressor [Bacteroidota bacterium]MCH8522950.1 transcriptional repressor [Balneolales bacterium]